MYDFEVQRKILMNCNHYKTAFVIVILHYSPHGKNAQQYLDKKIFQNKLIITYKYWNLLKKCKKKYIPFFSFKNHLNNLFLIKSFFQPCIDYNNVCICVYDPECVDQSAAESTGCIGCAHRVT